MEFLLTDDKRALFGKGFAIDTNGMKKHETMFGHGVGNVANRIKIADSLINDFELSLMKNTN